MFNLREKDSFKDESGNQISMDVKNTSDNEGAEETENKRSPSAFVESVSGPSPEECICLLSISHNLCSQILTTTGTEALAWCN